MGCGGIGGYLGITLSTVSWTGPGAYIIPESLRENDLIRDLVNPGFAEISDVVGVIITRPKAPFTYTNGWGSTMALRTPIATATATATFATPIGNPVRDSLDTRSRDSNERREIIYQQTFERTLESPFSGFGAPRPAQGTKQSLGRHSQIWMVMFSHGFLAAGLFVGFAFSLTWQSRNPPSVAGVWLHATLVVGLVQMLFYGQLPQQLFIIVSVAALTLRDRDGPFAPRPPDQVRLPAPVERD